MQIYLKVPLETRNSAGLHWNFAGEEHRNGRISVLCGCARTTDSWWRHRSGSIDHYRRQTWHFHPGPKRSLAKVRSEFFDNFCQYFHFCSLFFFCRFLQFCQFFYFIHFLDCVPLFSKFLSIFSLFSHFHFLFISSFSFISSIFYIFFSSFFFYFSMFLKFEMMFLFADLKLSSLI